MRKFLLASAMVLAAPILLASGAQAVPTLGLTIQSGATSIFRSATLGAAGGSVTFAPVTVGNFQATNIGTQLFSPNFIDLASFDVSSSTGGTLVVTLTGSGFTSLPGPTNWLTQFTGNVSNGSATVSAQTFLDNSDTLNNPGCSIGCTLLSSINLNGSASTATGTSDGSFALTEVITIVTTARERLSLDASVSDVPEPMSLALVGTGLAGLGLIRRRAAHKAA